MSFTCPLKCEANEENDVPVYITLSPSHQPHFSLLPLLLCLKPPIPPLHILTSLRLTSKEYSLDLNGVAPFVDVWVPWSVARKICEKLKVDILFWTENDTAKGLLSESVRDAVSWDKGVTIGHNWIPSISHIPPSSYSLAKLLDTPFPSLSNIPDDRCISTPIDPARRAHVLAEAENGDSSGIRHDQWGQTWEIILRWTILAWEDFLLHPSKPPKDRVTFGQPHDLPTLIHGLLPRVPQLGDSSVSPPSFSPVLPDLREVLRLDPAPPSPGLLSLLLVSARQLIQAVLPFKSSKSVLPPEDTGQLEVRARVNLGVVESLSMTLMAIWTLDRENARLAAQLNGGGASPLVVINSTPLDSAHRAQDYVQSAVSPPATRKRKQRVKGSTRKINEHSGRKETNGWHEDSLDDLRRKRGGSPLSSDSSLTPLQKTHIPGRSSAPTGSRNYHSDSSPENSEQEQTTEFKRNVSPTTYIRRPANGAASSKSEIEEALDSHSEDSVEEYEDPQDELKGAMRDGGEIMKQLVLQSEHWESVWVYFGAFGVLLVVLGLGWTG